MRTLPFTLDSGLSQISGVLREGPNELIIEYQSKLLGLIRSEIKVVRIPYQDIEDVSSSSNLFQTQIRILLKTLRNIGDFPAPKQGELVLAVDRKNRQQARSFALGVNLSASRFELEDDTDEWV